MMLDGNGLVVVVVSLGFIFVAILACGALFAYVAAAKRKRWGIVIAVPLIATAASLSLLLGAWQVLRDLGGVPSVIERDPVPTHAVSSTQRAPSVAIVSDADLLAVAAAPPKIELGDRPAEAASEPAAEMESFIDLDEVGSEAVGPDTDRPAWLDGAPEWHQKLFIDGPFATRGPHTVPSDFYAWVWEQAAAHQPDLGPTPPDWWASALDEIRERTVAETYTERRETSVGTVYLHHTLGQVDDDDREWLAEKAEVWFAKSRRESAVGGVALGGGALLAGVAILHGFLRIGRRPGADQQASREA